ncbi:IS5 family transposase [Streptomyces lannensis]|uniref:IS5 family transposase n=1 Tax=Streptomyces lannensis TaxID=766498 RepID=UPI003CD0675E
MSEAGGGYPSDLTDEQWALVEPLLPPARVGPKGGRREKHPRRRIVDAIFYVVRTGCAWRELPKDFAPWPTVYWYVAWWHGDGTVERIHDALRAQLREVNGRNAEPSAGLIDSQSVRTADAVPAATRRFDAGKKVKSRKRFLVTNTLGLLLAVHVIAANVQDRNGAQRPPLWTRLDHPWIRKIWADQGFAGRLVDWTAQALGRDLEIDSPDRRTPVQATGAPPSSSLSGRIVLLPEPSSRLKSGPYGCTCPALQPAPWPSSGQSAACKADASGKGAGHEWPQERGLGGLESRRGASRYPHRLRPALQRLPSGVGLPCPGLCPVRRWPLAFVVVRVPRLTCRANVHERHRTGTRTVGKRVGGNPSRVRISYPPPLLSPGNTSKGPTSRWGPSTLSSDFVVPAGFLSTAGVSGVSQMASAIFRATSSSMAPGTLRYRARTLAEVPGSHPVVPASPQSASGPAAHAAGPEAQHLHGSSRRCC